MTDAEKIKMLEKITGKKPLHRPDGKETMQELHGVRSDKTCRECIHCKRLLYGRTIYKCDLWHVNHSQKTDIRVTGPACGKFKPHEIK